MAGITRESIAVMVKSLTRFNMTQEEMKRALKASYESAGVDWHDSKYVELGESLSEVERVLSSSSVEITNLITKLQVVDNYLEVIEGIKL